MMMLMELMTAIIFVIFISYCPPSPGGNEIGSEDMVILSRACIRALQARKETDFMHLFHFSSQPAGLERSYCTSRHHVTFNVPVHSLHCRLPPATRTPSLARSQTLWGASRGQLRLEPRDAACSCQCVLTDPTGCVFGRDGALDGGWWGRRGG